MYVSWRVDEAADLSSYLRGEKTRKGEQGANNKSLCLRKEKYSKYPAVHKISTFTGREN